MTSLGYLYLWLMLCGHLAGDYFLQPQCLADSKRHSSRGLLLHSGIYAASVLFFAGLPFGAGALLFTLSVAVSHFLIDLITIKLSAPKKDGFHAAFRHYRFAADQLLHAAVIFLAAFICGSGRLGLNALGLKLFLFYNSLHPAVPFSESARLLFAVLLILKPSNIIIREMNPKEQCFADKPAGKNIGILERILIFLFVILQQYAAIALIFTAKSITRYDKIAKDPQFAEYYLTGTLLSLLLAIVAGLLAAPLFTDLMKTLSI